jgi:DnaJ-class molecular chaperone
MDKPWFVYIDVAGGTVVPTPFSTEPVARAWGKQAVKELRETGHLVHRAYIVWYCPRCEGRGTVQSRARRGKISCPNCHGDAEKEVEL